MQMSIDAAFCFPPFRLDLASAQLWRDDQEIILRRKTFAVLVYLVNHPGQLITKDALLDAVWPDVSVSDSMPAVSITELRKALGDDVTTPRFIATVHRRGYRFIGKVTTGAPMERASTPQSVLRGSKAAIVGREDELARLQIWHSRAHEGRRQIIFISGEAGIGKTTFVRLFLDSMTKGVTQIAHGQCIEQYGAGEPYMPVLEALTRLSQVPGGERVAKLLYRFAPTWLAQMPALLTPEQSTRLQVQTQGVTHQRMLREMVQALEALTADAPLVLLLEDLQWSDFSTLELISAVARRSEPARLLILGTHRPVAMLAHDHPLRVMKQELELHNYCEELQLALLNQDDITDYLERRFSTNGMLAFEGLAPVIYERTDGNPLFMVNVVDYFVGAGLLASFHEGSAAGLAESSFSKLIEVPRNIQHMIERNFERLQPEEQKTLGAASVAGMEFSAAAVAAGLERSQAEVEACCTRLAHREQFLTEKKPIVWPDGTVASGFRFHHSLYQEVLYAQLSLDQRVQFHRLIAAREEAGYCERVGEIAAEVAHQYEQANDKSKAIHYFRIAGERAVARGSVVEAEVHYRRALELLTELPQSTDCDRREFSLRIALLNVLWGSKSWAHPDALSAGARLRELALKLGESSQLADIVHIAFLLGSGQIKQARELAERAFLNAEVLANRTSVCAAHAVFGQALLWRAEYMDAEKHFELGILHYEQGDPGEWGLDAYALAPIAHLVLGYPDRAKCLMREALAHVEHCDNLDRIALMHVWASIFFALLLDAPAVVEHAQALKEIANTRPVWIGASDLFMSQALMIEAKWLEGVGYLRKTIAFHDRVCLLSFRGWEMLCESEFLMAERQIDKALVVTAKAVALAEEFAHHRAPALLQRAKLLAEAGIESPAVCEAYHAAIECALNQGAKFYELQATTSFARWLASQGRAIEAQTVLMQSYGWFTEGFDTVALKEAKSLLDDLSTMK